MSHDWLFINWFGGYQHLFKVNIVQNLRVGVWLRKGKVYFVIIILPFMSESQRVVIEHSSLLWSLFGRRIIVILLFAIIWTWWNDNLRHWLLLVTWIRLHMILLIECFLYPIFLIRVSTSCNNVFLPSLHVSLDILTLILIIDNVVPRIFIIIITFLPLGLLLFGLYHNSHLMLVSFVPSTSWYTWLGKVHYVEGVRFPFNTTCAPKVKPLLMPSCVCINLHEQVVMVYICSRPVCLEQISTFEHGVKHKNVLTILFP